LAIQTISIQPGEQVSVNVDEYGSGRPILLLHGGAGPQSVAGFARLLADRAPAQVYVPTHPGFGGSARPAWLQSIRGLAAIYAGLLDQLEINDVIVVGNSIGGWIGAELALSGSPRVSGLVLVNAVGIVVEGQPVTDIFGLSMDELSRLSYHNPAAFRRDPATMTEAEQRGMAANRAALTVYGGQPSMTDPTLAQRLSGISVPTLVLWGESDGIVAPDYGRSYAAAIPAAAFQLLPNTGHVPQLETPEQLLEAVWAFAEAQAATR
jgi:pimeloyl-ACP methyl ester carboxylesterase